MKKWVLKLVSVFYRGVSVFLIFVSLLSGCGKASSISQNSPTLTQQDALYLQTSVLTSLSLFGEWAIPGPSIPTSTVPLNVWIDGSTSSYNVQFRYSTFNTQVLDSHTIMSISRDFVVTDNINKQWSLAMNQTTASTTNMTDYSTNIFYSITGSLNQEFSTQNSTIKVSLSNSELILEAESTTQTPVPLPKKISVKYDFSLQTQGKTFTGTCSGSNSAISLSTPFIVSGNIKTENTVVGRAIISYFGSFVSPAITIYDKNSNQLL